MSDSDILHYGSSWNPYHAIPPPEERTPITWTTIPQVLMYWAPFYLMAFLVRRADTHLLRLLLLPIAVSTAAYCTYWFKVEDPRFSTIDWGRTFMALVVVAKNIDFAFARNGRFKIGEKELPPIGGTVKPQTGSREGRILPQWFRDASDIIFTMRGIGWDFGKGVYVPKESRSLERGPFLRATVLSLLWNYIVIDVLDSLFKFIPRAGQLSQCLDTVASAIHLASGFIIQYGMDAWKATSLHEYWGNMFHVYGGYVGGLLAGPMGWCLARVGIILEGLWKKATGKPVGGVAGWFWTAFFVLVIGQMSTDAWATQGLIGGFIVPPPLSVTRRVLFPAVRSLLRLWRSS
ncbi:uncharacterized protein B0H18DRAFT_996321 [Fomitopsis serialis]|uniref:uncharacterized protein n=1 Tax=Fomitopsis serialis TaxID=139415 RepID=UPI00200787BB|nr:uncharacterized protein B0H18DRAFT_996321 [Neoantrodia serialis]KAH9929800.1 hypothetical protein B0H18DRAFT_996321 [Neoantrodia serialis]